MPPMAAASGLASVMPMLFHLGVVRRARPVIVCNEAYCLDPRSWPRRFVEFIACLSAWAAYGFRLSPSFAKLQSGSFAGQVLERRPRFVSFSTSLTISASDPVDLHLHTFASDGFWT